MLPGCSKLQADVLIRRTTRATDITTCHVYKPRRSNKGATCHLQYSYQINYVHSNEWIGKHHISLFDIKCFTCDDASGILMPLASKHHVLFSNRRRTNLDSRFGESDPHGDFFPHEDVGVVRFGETPFEFVELCGRESRPVPFLLGWFVDVAAARQRTAGDPQRLQSGRLAQRPRLLQRLQLSCMLLPLQLFVLRPCNITITVTITGTHRVDHGESRGLAADRSLHHARQ